MIAIIKDKYIYYIVHTYDLIRIAYKIFGSFLLSFYHFVWYQINDHKTRIENVLACII